MKTNDNEQYKAQDHKDRNDYLSSLAQYYGIDIMTVRMISDVLGPSEDFDALIIELEDYASMGLFD